MLVVCFAQMDGKNKLYFGDNLKIPRGHVADAGVDLIYLDSPFNSNTRYNVVLKENVAQGPHPGPAAFQLFPAAQITAFEDTWHWSMKAEAVNKEIVTPGPAQTRDLDSIWVTRGGSEFARLRVYDGKSMSEQATEAGR